MQCVSLLKSSRGTRTKFFPIHFFPTYVRTVIFPSFKVYTSIRKMLRSFFLPKFLASNVNNISKNPVCVQSVRFRRKPRWLPTAKSKIFRIPVRPKLNEVERIELLRINNNYK